MLLNKDIDLTATQTDRKTSLTLGERAKRLFDRRRQGLQVPASVTIDRLIRLDPDAITDEETLELVESLEVVDARSMHRFWAQKTIGEIADEVRKLILSSDRQAEKILAISESPQAMEDSIDRLNVEIIQAREAVQAAQAAEKEAVQALESRKEDLRVRRDLVKGLESKRKAYPGLPFPEVE